MEARIDLTEGSVSQHLWRIALPASMGMLFETMFNFVDTYWAGTVSTQALAALAVSFPVFFLIIALNQGLSTAASALAAFQWGRKNEAGAKRIGIQVLYYAVPATLFITLGGLAAGRPLFLLIGAQDTFLDISLEYINTIYYGAALFVLSSALNGLLIAHGNSKVMRTTLIAGFFLNCVLDPWFLHGGLGLPALGIQGIALATLVVKAMGLVYIFYKVRQEGLLPNGSPQDYVWNPATQWEIFRLAMPASLGMLTIASGIFVATAFLKPYGPAAVAAYGACLRIEQLFLLPVIGISISVQALTGQNFGAKKYERIHHTIKQAIRAALFILICGSIFMLTMPRTLLALFSDDPEVIRIGAQYLRIAALTSASYAIMTQCIAVMQGLQRPGFAMGVGLTRQIIGRLIFFSIVQTYTVWGLQGIWWSIFALNWMTALFVLTYTIRSVRRLST